MPCRKKTWLAIAVVSGLILGLIVGCMRSTTSPTNDPMHPFVTITELGYCIEYEYDPATRHLATSNPHWSDFTDLAQGPKDQPMEYVGVIVQGHYNLRIVDGEIILNNRNRGKMNKGDHLKVTRDLRVWLNGTKLGK